MKLFSSSLLVLSSFLFMNLSSSVAVGQPQAEAPGAAGTPVSTILKPDGSLDLTQGFSGSLDVRGFRMVTGPKGEPRFIPAASGEASKTAAVLASGPESGDDDIYWDDQFPVAGAAGAVSAAAADGSGNIYIGGLFTAVGNVVASRIAKWNGTSWSALGSGMNDTVFALAVSGSDVYAGGYFTTAGGVSANHIAKWNGTAWSALGTGTNGAVQVLAVSGSDVYAGGWFIMAGGVSANYVAKWNGSVWSALGSGVDFGVFALAVSGSDVYAGGIFTTAGGVSANYVAKWNGSSWSALGTGMNSVVYALAVSGSDLYAGG
ncbi:MAG: hypothetical protein V2A74_08595, partial [bacterium]